MLIRKFSIAVANLLDFPRVFLRATIQMVTRQRVVTPVMHE